MEHTKEPWLEYIDVAIVMTPDPDGPDAAVLSFDDYKRARACVNACAGIPTEILLNEVAELGSKHPWQLINASRIKAEQQRDELLAALKEARRWIGDGDLADGLAKEFWTISYAELVKTLDTAIAKCET